MDDKLKNLIEQDLSKENFSKDKLIYHPQADYRQPLSVLPVIGIGKIRRDYPPEAWCVLHRGGYGTDDDRP